MNLRLLMGFDTYGLSTEQYRQFFEDNVRFSAELYLSTCNILSAKGVGNVDFKTALEMYQENIYVTNDDCRRYQKANNPEVLETKDELYELVPSRKELMEQVESLHAKVEALTDYVSNLVTITTSGLEGIATTLDKPVD